ncbi:MAG: histidine phosphatase family protein [Pseudomonadales bacterium]|nr:histidine phosphatase family protein [Pseudomonadales bacterium]MCP5184851.1 histidine phosphatase family protein [Pseudomonadales bacterium]
MADQLLLIRHGLIAANREGRWHGSTDSSLTWQGRRQAKRAAAQVQRHPPAPTALYVSPLRRCRSTAAPIADAFGLEPIIHDDLREWDIGEWENQPFTVLAKEYNFMGKIRHDPHFAPPGGESLAAVTERMVAAFREIHACHEGRVVIVSHGASMAAALAHLLDNDPHRWSHYLTENCSLTELVLDIAPYVNFFNRTEHL